MNSLKVILSFWIAYLLLVCVASHARTFSESSNLEELVQGAQSLYMDTGWFNPEECRKLRTETKILAQACSLHIAFGNFSDSLAAESCLENTAELLKSSSNCPLIKGASQMGYNELKELDKIIQVFLNRAIQTGVDSLVRLGPGKALRLVILRFLKLSIDSDTTFKISQGTIQKLMKNPWIIAHSALESKDMEPYLSAILERIRECVKKSVCSQDSIEIILAPLLTDTTGKIRAALHDQTFKTLFANPEGYSRLLPLVQQIVSQTGSTKNLDSLGIRLATAISIVQFLSKVLDSRNLGNLDDSLAVAYIPLVHGHWNQVLPGDPSKANLDTALIKSFGEKFRVDVLPKEQNLPRMRDKIKEILNSEKPDPGESFSDKTIDFFKKLFPEKEGVRHLYFLLGTYGVKRNPPGVKDSLQVILNLIYFEDGLYLSRITRTQGIDTLRETAAQRLADTLIANLMAELGHSEAKGAFEAFFSGKGVTDKDFLKRGNRLVFVNLESEIGWDYYKNLDVVFKGFAYPTGFEFDNPKEKASMRRFGSALKTSLIKGFSTRYAFVHGVQGGDSLLVVNVDELGNVGEGKYRVQFSQQNGGPMLTLLIPSNVFDSTNSENDTSKLFEKVLDALRRHTSMEGDGNFKWGSEGGEKRIPKSIPEIKRPLSLRKKDLAIGMVPFGGAHFWRAWDQDNRQDWYWGTGLFLGQGAIAGAFGLLFFPPDGDPLVFTRANYLGRVGLGIGLGASFGLLQLTGWWAYLRDRPMDEESLTSGTSVGKVGMYVGPDRAGFRMNF